MCPDGPFSADDRVFAELRAEIRRRPTVTQLVELADQWQRLANEALARDQFEWAATCQERAAVAAHGLGLLEDAMLDIHLGRRSEAGPDEDVFFSSWTADPPRA